MTRQLKASPVSGAGPNRPSSDPIRVDRTTTITPAGRKASAVDMADQPDSVCRYCVTRNWKEIYVPNSVTAPMFARRSPAEAKMPNGTSGSRLRRSIATNTPDSAATAADEPTVLADPQPACWADTTV